MKLLRNLLLHFFDLIDEFYHQKRIEKFIKKINYILVEFHVDKIYENYNPDKIHNLLLENGFTLQKKFSFPFPFTTWEDRLYKNSKFLN